MDNYILERLDSNGEWSALSFDPDFSTLYHVAVKRMKALRGSYRIRKVSNTTVWSTEA